MKARTQQFKSNNSCVIVVGIDANQSINQLRGTTLFVFSFWLHVPD